VRFFSGKFSPAELNYTVLERELLSILLAMIHWSYLFEGASQEIIVRTDHKNLEEIENMPIASERHIRAMHLWSRYNLKLTYYAVWENVMADMLSRPEGPRPIHISECRIWQQPAICYTNNLQALPRLHLIIKRHWLGLAHDHLRLGHRRIPETYILLG
jgi:RNase H-like domain found in reverse transcriptase